MYIQRFGSSLLILLLFVPGEENSLLSRFRNPNHFVASEEDGYLTPEDLDENMYSDAIREVPALEEHLLRQRNRERKGHIEMPYLKEKLPGERVHADFDVSHGKEVGVNSTRARPSGRLSAGRACAGAAAGAGASLPSSLGNGSLAERDGETRLGPRNASRRLFSGWFTNYWSWTGEYVDTCYRCGLNEKDIPMRSTCHDAWNSEDWRHRTQARYFIAECYYNTRYWRSRVLSKRLWRNWPHYRFHDRGLRTQYYGVYVKGCFKRWTDVGTVYTARGCRAHPPYQGDSFVGHRFRRLEYTLRRRKDACVHSPHASLVPFARGISLYVRFHVCVCPGHLCNRAPAPAPAPAPCLAHYTLHVFMLLLYVLFI